MKDILSEIIANKRFEVDLQKQAISIEQLQEGISEVPTSRSMKQALASSASGIIAEFKRRSPSKGWIKEEACPEEIVPSYAAAGASALSILTDEKFFGGSLKDIRTARPLVEIQLKLFSCFLLIIFLLTIYKLQTSLNFTHSFA